MAIADMIPTLDDAALADLNTNAKRLQVSADSPLQKRAELLLPLIEAELAERKAKKVAAAPPRRKTTRAPKAAAGAASEA